MSARTGNPRSQFFCSTATSAVPLISPSERGGRPGTAVDECSRRRTVAAVERNGERMSCNYFAVPRVLTSTDRSERPASPGPSTCSSARAADAGRRWAPARGNSRRPDKRAQLSCPGALDDESDLAASRPRSGGDHCFAHNRQCYPPSALDADTRLARVLPSIYQAAGGQRVPDGARAGAPWTVTRERSSLARRVGAAELAHGRVELLGPLKLADMPGAGNHHKSRVGDGPLKLLGHGEW
jgi:hypothetical protein